MLILLLAGMIMAYLLQQKVYERYWNHNLDIDVSFSRPFVYEGEECALKEIISNDKILPLPAVEVRLGVSKKLVFSGEALENSNVSDQSYRRDVFALFSHQRVIRTLPFTCTRRGFYQITRSEVVGSDFFFHRDYNEQHPQKAQLFVYPGTVDVRRIQYICRMISGSVVRQNRLYPDPFEFSGIREYQKTDPMHHVNWKASARSGNLMVNQFDSTTNVDMTILLDTQDNGILKYEELTEEGIRIAASLANVMNRKNLDLYIRGNGKGFQKDQEELNLYLKTGAGKISELNRKLACIDTTLECRSIQELVKEECEKIRSGQIYCIISKNADQLSDEVLAGLCREENTVLWIMPVLPGSESVQQSGKGITVIPWEVQR